MAPIPAPLPSPAWDLNLAEQLRNMTDPMNIIDRDYRVLWTNSPERGSGRADHGAVGRICYQAFMDREEPCPECPVREVFQTGRPIVMEKKAELSNGFHLHTEVWAYPILDPDGSLNRVIKIGHPVKNGLDNIERNQGPVVDLKKLAREYEPANGSLESDISPRELEVLELLARGMTNVEIADELMISPHTVKTHVISLFNKFGTTKRTQTAVMAVRLGLV